LARRGLRNVKLMFPDDHKGCKAVTPRIPGAVWQRCRVSLTRISFPSHPMSTFKNSLQWSLDPHSSSPLSAHTVILS